MFDVVCTGEILIDFISLESGKKLKDVRQFQKNAGGSVANVAVSLSKLGVKTAFCGKVSTDNFGDYLIETLEKNGVDTTLTIRDALTKTCLAFVSINPEGNPDFEFFDEKASYSFLHIDEVDLNAFERSKLYHFGSIPLLKSPTSETLIALLDRAKSAGMLATFDPNIRPKLIKNRNEYMKLFKYILPKVDVVKMSDQDLHYIFPNLTIEKAAEKLYDYGERLLVITLGNEGCLAICDGQTFEVPAYKVRVVDTTGCGDAFMGGLIYGIINNGFENIDETLSFANAAAALVATRKGAILSMPTLKEIEKFLRF